MSQHEKRGSELGFNAEERLKLVARFIRPAIFGEQGGEAKARRGGSAAAQRHSALQQWQRLGR
jgi:hypothetical protein